MSVNLRLLIQKWHYLSRVPSRKYRMFLEHPLSADPRTFDWAYMIGAASALLFTLSKLTQSSVYAESEEEEDRQKSRRFRDQKINEYENRLRAFSTPDKIFRYFATLIDAETGDIFMRPEDFVRSIVPNNLQPKEYGLDCFQKINAKSYIPNQHESAGLSKSVFGDLISFGDYLFMISILSTNRRQIEIAFRVFDLDGNGEVTLEEFTKVYGAFLEVTPTGSRHRGKLQNLSKGVISCLFKNDSEKIVAKQLIDYKEKLQDEVMKIEFTMYNPQNEKISELSFSKMLMEHTTISDDKKDRLKKRLRKSFPAKSSPGLSFDEFREVYKLMMAISDVEMALSFHHVSGNKVDRELLKVVGKKVAGVDLSDHVVNVLFCIFDENGDGSLSYSEFVTVLKERLYQGLDRPKDTGFIRFFSAIGKCIMRHRPLLPLLEA